MNKVDKIIIINITVNLYDNHFRLAEWWQTVIPRDRYFYPILTWLMDYFSCSRFKTAFSFSKKGFQKFLNTMRCDITWIRHFNITMTSLFFQCVVVRFLSFPRFGVGMWDMGKNRRNSNLVCKKKTLNCNSKPILGLQQPEREQSYTDIYYMLKSHFRVKIQRPVHWKII